MLLPLTINAELSFSWKYTALYDRYKLNLHKVNKKYSNIYPTRCNVTQFILSGNCYTSFG
jgi:hypothetical protein